MKRAVKKCEVCKGDILIRSRRKYCCPECARIGASMLYYKKRMVELNARIKKLTSRR